MKRCDKFVLEAENGITFNFSEGKNGEIIIRAVMKDFSNSKKFMCPPIPEGYKYVEGTWNDGFVIERNLDGSQFVWIPVEVLENDGTIDGIHFNKKFGRRAFGNSH